MKEKYMLDQLSYKNKTVLVTGHTGFKGYWLCKILKHLGANVVGLSDGYIFKNNEDLIKKSHFRSYFVDIQDEMCVTQALLEINPDYIFHLAAQSLVRKSYMEPKITWMTNVVGTLNIINAANKLDVAPILVCATTDKVYKNSDLGTRLFAEDDALGGDDPYSASKAACELIIQSTAFCEKQNPLGPRRIISVRAGNVVGGADWSEDRLVPDIIRSVELNVPLKVRLPTAVRPWQHVLDCCYAYLLIGQYNGSYNTFNVGPSDQGFLTVDRIIEFSKHYFDVEDSVELDETKPEKMFLQLDVSRLKQETGFQPRIKGTKIFELTFEWYKEYLHTGACIANKQIELYFRE